MTTLFEPTIEYGLDYHCGCQDRWLMLRLPEEEPALKTVDFDCHPDQCNACVPYFNTVTRRGHHCPNGRLDESEAA